MDFIDAEIQRIINLKERQVTIYAKRNATFAIFYSLLDDDDKEKHTVAVEYYENALKLLNIKIEFWNYLKKKEFPKNFIEIMNEGLNDWLMTAWAHLGMQEHKQQGDKAIQEFEFFKTMINRYDVIQDKKKPTRRGGKKHRKS